MKDRLDLIRNSWHEVGLSPAKRLHLAQVDRGLTIRQISPVDTVAPRAFEQRVIDIGDVLDVADADAGRLDESNQDVVRAKRKCMAHMSRVVRGHSAHVEPDRPAALTRTGLDTHFPPAQRVVYAESMRSVSHPSSHP